MDTLISNALEIHDKETNDIIRASYQNMMKEINDALNNILTMTSLDLERSLREGLSKLKSSLLPKTETKIREKQGNNKFNQAASKEELYQKYKKIIKF